MVQKGQKTQRGKTAEKKRQSVILYYAHKMSEWLYRLVLYSAIGRFMTGYHKTEDHMREGLVYRLLRGKTKRSDRWSFRFRLRFSAMIEESLVCRVLQRIVHTLLQCRCLRLLTLMVVFLVQLMLQHTKQIALPSPYRLFMCTLQKTLSSNGWA